jgi:putative GTP pyrophosphokinase
MENGLLKTFVDDSGFVRNEETMTEMIEQFQDFQTFMMMYNCAIKEVRTKFEVLNDELSVTNKRNPIQMIKSRVKKPLSIVNKLKRKNFEMSMTSILDNINDVAGVRVICGFPGDIYRLAEAFLSQDDVELIERKDYIENPKRNGYRSLHLIVTVPIYLHDKKKLMRVEVQFRTIAMDWWASLEHQIRYKKEVAVTKDDAKELRDCAEQAALLDYRMEQLYKSIQGPDA